MTNVVDRVCCAMAVMSCHARHYRPCVLSKGSDVMPRQTLPTVCCPRAVMSCHAQHYRLCVVSKGSDVMPHPMLPSMSVVQRR